MKRTLCILLCFPILLLGGCGGIYGNYREIERLSVVDTMGIDHIPGGVKLCFAASSLTEDESVILSGSGDSIESAIENIEKRSGDRELFCRQTEYIIIGERSARDGLESTLSYIAGSPLMRIDTPLYIVKGAEAGTLMKDCAGISEVMAGAVQSSRHRADSSVTTAADVMRDLLRRKSALISVLNITSPADVEEEKTASVTGYAVIRSGRLVSFLTEEQSVGAGFLIGNTGACSITVGDSRGGKAVLGITGGHADIFPVWAEDGSIERVNITASVEATVDEISGSGSMENAVYARHLTGQLEAGISERINSVLRLSSSLGADFLGLGEQVERVDPERFRTLSRPFDELLPVLEVQVSVKGTLRHANDTEGGTALSDGRTA